MYLPNLEQTICQVLDYQSREYKIKTLDTMHVYLGALEKLQTREIYNTKTFNISSVRNQELKMDALKIVARYNRMQHNKTKRIEVK